MRIKPKREEQPKEEKMIEEPIEDEILKEEEEEKPEQPQTSGFNEGKNMTKVVEFTSKAPKRVKKKKPVEKETKKKPEVELPKEEVLEFGSDEETNKIEEDTPELEESEGKYKIDYSFYKNEDEKQTRSSSLGQEVNLDEYPEKSMTIFNNFYIKRDKMQKSKSMNDVREQKEYPKASLHMFGISDVLQIQHIYVPYIAPTIWEKKYGKTFRNSD